MSSHYQRRAALCAQLRSQLEHHEERATIARLVREHALTAPVELLIRLPARVEFVKAEGALCDPLRLILPALAEAHVTAAAAEVRKTFTALHAEFDAIGEPIPATIFPHSV